MDNFTKISAIDFKTELHEWDKVLLDVRTPWEAQMFWVIENNQLLIDIYAQWAAEKILKLDKTKKYLIYCHSWSRSTTVRNFMKQNSFKYAKDLEWWIDAWNLLK